MKTQELEQLGKPYKIYVDVIEQGAIDQFIGAMKHKSIIKGALMPDVHTGYSLPIGAVVASKDTIFPSFVGYDIGCGMCALKLDGIDINQVKLYANDIFDEIYKRIPVGFNVNEKQISYSLDGLTEKGKEIAKSKKYDLTLGSLGGGNHFIEVGHDENDDVWVVIHSGSRGVGHGIASHYMTLSSSDTDILAKEFDDTHKDLLLHNPDKYEEHKQKWIAKKVGVLRPKEGNYCFDVKSQNGKDYIQDLKWALDYALANRKEMMSRIVNAITSCLDISCYELDFSELINRNHNHAELKDGLWIHRKGATHAEDGMLGVIPGNMRDGSFIVRGKGNAESLYSSSHGAGRVLGRKEAQRTLTMDDFANTMDGIVGKIDESTLDESPFAYKDIFKVMDQQSDLVDVLHHIKPLINIKG